MTTTSTTSQSLRSYTKPQLAEMLANSNANVPNIVTAEYLVKRYMFMTESELRQTIRRNRARDERNARECAAQA